MCSPILQCRVVSSARSLADWLTYIQAQHPQAIAMGLDRVREVAGRMGLGRPGRQVITVGGTNGKGSTVAFIESIARAAGWKVGAYTSPHLLRYNERVRIDGMEAEDAALVAAFEAVEAARGDTALTYFEYGTLAALWLFQRSGLDLAILEVGLGGRLDAVNVVDPDVAVITTVDLDHTEWLGPDRDSIGHEKAGIARAWKPLVLGEVDIPGSVLRHAYAIAAAVIQAGNDFFHEPLEDGHWRWREVGYELELPPVPLDAPVQRANAATAIAAVRALESGDALAPAVFAAGVAQACVAGRLQRMQREGVEIRLDVGHNPQAARALAAWLQAHPVQGPTVAVFAALADKAVGEVVDALTPQVARWQLAGIEDAGPRSLSAEALLHKLPALQVLAALHVSVAQALDAAVAQAGPTGRVLVFGSFHTVGQALAALRSGN
jgi:dihydrofolate synthase / folylpolyglutamate synthase